MGFYNVESFEPTVIFFGITNLPATFQVIINEILRDMINEGKVAAFVNDILVGTEIEEEHDKIMEECYKMVSKTETISYTFINLIGNIKEYNMGKI